MPKKCRDGNHLSYRYPRYKRQPNLKANKIANQVKSETTANLQDEDNSLAIAHHIQDAVFSSQQDNQILSENITVEKLNHPDEDIDDFKFMMTQDITAKMDVCAKSEQTDFTDTDMVIFKQEENGDYDVTVAIKQEMDDDYEALDIIKQGNEEHSFTEDYKMPLEEDSIEIEQDPLSINTEYSNSEDDMELRNIYSENALNLNLNELYGGLKDDISLEHEKQKNSLRNIRINKCHIRSNSMEENSVEVAVVKSDPGEEANQNSGRSRSDSNEDNGDESPLQNIKIDKYLKMWKVLYPEVDVQEQRNMYQENKGSIPQTMEKVRLLNEKRKRENIKSKLMETTCTDEKSYQCSNCNKDFNGKCDFVRHKSLEHTEGKLSYKCNKCYTWEYHLERHKIVHTGERQYKCSDCNKAFTWKSQLERHKLVHSEERPYKCSDCDKAFTMNFLLVRHKIIHTGERPFKCGNCSQTFTRKDHLVRHKIVHTGLETV